MTRTDLVARLARLEQLSVGLARERLLMKEAMHAHGCPLNTAMDMGDMGVMGVSYIDTAPPRPRIAMFTGYGKTQRYINAVLKERRKSLHRHQVPGDRRYADHRPAQEEFRRARDRAGRPGLHPSHRPCRLRLRRTHRLQRPDGIAGESEERGADAWGTSRGDFPGPLTQRPVATPLKRLGPNARA